MKRTIKRAAIVTVLAALMIFAAFATACAPATFTVTFDYNYDGAPAAQTVTVEDGERATAPDTDPSRDGYEFTGWYSDEACTSEADFGRGVTADVTYYAGWRQTAYTVTFDLNYDGGTPTVQTVEIGGTATRPSSPARDGYLFTGWYSDQACTTEYDFTSVVEGDTVIYAGWEEDTGNNVTITYMYNYEGAPDDGVYDSLVQKTGRQFPRNVEASRDGYYFVGWYLDAECTETYSSSDRVTEDTVLYALWYEIHTFEAEYTDVSAIEGSGYSGNESGTGIIDPDTYNMGASNGYYVGWLYNPGIELKFEITSDRDVTNAVLALRLSAEFGDKLITDDNFTVAVNGEKITYNDIAFTNVPDGSADAKMPFSTYILNRNISLEHGDNVITLTVSNNEKGEGGTMNATAPLVDCLYIYSDAEIGWAEGYPLKDNLIGM
ncbi:MAG TPA: InlB B-repeat-containing protein [Firmicutes bacterium]|nr:InlB B-repeat-containing protein [Bacillota bacterium]